MSAPAYSADEMMTVTAARQLRNGAVCFVGIGLPSAACNLARRTHAPELVLIYESGTVGARPQVLPLSIGDGELADTATVVVPLPEVFAHYLQRGRVDFGFLGAAQIDRFGNLNTTVIGAYDKPKVRLPGSGGAPEIATHAREVLIIMKQSPRSFVPRLDFLTSAGYLDGCGARGRAGFPGQGTPRRHHRLRHPAAPRGERGARACSPLSGGHGGGGSCGDRLAAARGSPRRAIAATAQLRSSGPARDAGRHRTRPHRSRAHSPAHLCITARGFPMASPHIRTPLPGPKAQALLARDRAVSSPSYPRDYPFVIAKGRGTEVWDVDGNRFLDFAAGIAVCSTGHAHPQVVEAIKTAADDFLHISSDYWHERMTRLGERVNELNPVGEAAQIFICQSGTESVEGALKLARYVTGRPRFIGFLGGFHGRSMGSLSFTASKYTQQAGFFPTMPGVTHVPYPNTYRPLFAGASSKVIK